LNTAAQHYALLDLLFFDSELAGPEDRQEFSRPDNYVIRLDFCNMISFLLLRVADILRLRMSTLYKLHGAALEYEIIFDPFRAKLPRYVIITLKYRDQYVDTHENQNKFKFQISVQREAAKKQGEACEKPS
jgi:hypothetical protein